MNNESTASSFRVRYEHIVLNEDGVSIIAGTNMKVLELVLGKIAYGWSPEELNFQHPYLTLGQIHCAITVGLRLRGVDVLTACKDGASELDDSALLDRAGELERVLFT
ncbi:MAG: hypothetical protein V3S14_01265 [Anaerolineae bacterium]